MGCPNASLAEACALAAEFGFPAIELRSLSGTVELPGLFAKTGWTPAVVRETCARHAVRLASAGSSFKLVGSTAADRAALLAFCDWADSLGIPFVRTFGGGKWGTPLTEADFQSAAQSVEWWRGEKSARGWRLDLLLETHDAFSGSEPCLELNARLNSPLHLIWDTHHTWRYAGESPRDSWNKIGHLVRHVHFKDSVDRPSARHPYTYVLCGEGQMPLAETMEVLRANKFTGGVSLEWELLWHPYLDPLNVALRELVRQPWFAHATASRRPVSVTAGAA